MSRFAVAALAVLALSPISQAGDTKIKLARNDVVPVVLRSDISTVYSRKGDSFSAEVEGDRDIPHGSRFEGRVLYVRQKTQDRPAAIDLRFDRLVLPGGKAIKVRAFLISFDKDHVVRNSDGHFVASKNVVNRENMVLGGMVGGFLLGEAIKKPFELTFLGALAGIVASENTPDKPGDVVISRGAKMGALIGQDIVFDTASAQGRGARDLDRDRDGALRIRVDGRNLEFKSNAQPFTLDGETMIPLAQAASQCGMSIDRLHDGAILVSNSNAMLRLERGSSNYRLNGSKGSLDHAIVEKGGLDYVPIEVLALMRVGNVSVNGTIVEDRS